MDIHNKNADSTLMCWWENARSEFTRQVICVPQLRVNTSTHSLTVLFSHPPSISSLHLASFHPISLLHTYLKVHIQTDQLSRKHTFQIYFFQSVKINWMHLLGPCTGWIWILKANEWHLSCCLLDSRESQIPTGYEFSLNCLLYNIPQEGNMYLSCMLHKGLSEKYPAIYCEN